jgi:hypothetical protein
MLRNAKDLFGLTIRATNGEIGTVKEFYFDDETWAIRYLVVDTGGWLGGRLVLISPMSVVGEPDWQSKQLHVSLTQKQVEHSPDVNTHLPVSRQHEMEHLAYFGFPLYWGGSDLWGSELYPAALALPVNALPTFGDSPAIDDKTGRRTADSYLRSSQEVTGYHIDASDGEMGHLDGFIVDDETWAIRYIEVATRNWWPGKKVLVSPAWIESMSWSDAKVSVKLSREVIQNGPEYIESDPITREYEDRLHAHYGLPPYWTRGAKHPPVHSLTGA